MVGSRASCLRSSGSRCFQEQETLPNKLIQPGTLNPEDQTLNTKMHKDALTGQYIDQRPLAADTLKVTPYSQSRQGCAAESGWPQSYIDR